MRAQHTARGAHVAPLTRSLRRACQLLPRRPVPQHNRSAQSAQHLWKRAPGLAPRPPQPSAGPRRASAQTVAVCRANGTARRRHSAMGRPAGHEPRRRPPEHESRPPVGTSAAGRRRVRRRCPRRPGRPAAAQEAWPSRFARRRVSAASPSGHAFHAPASNEASAQAGSAHAQSARAVLRCRRAVRCASQRQSSL